jgi:hypothetical protein
MDIAEFAEQHNVRPRRDECGETLIPGKKAQVLAVRLAAARAAKKAA